MIQTILFDVESILTFHQPAIKEVLQELHKKGFGLGLITSQKPEKHETENTLDPFLTYFDAILPEKPDQSPHSLKQVLLDYRKKSNSPKEEVLYISTSTAHSTLIEEFDIHFGLALWNSTSPKNTKADFYFSHPREILYTLLVPITNKRERNWVKLAMELQFLAQGGLTYSNDVFDIERFERIREISGEMISMGSGYSKEFVENIFCNETGFQTPKMDSRAAIFNNDKILLVQENNGTWSLPGGWVDVDESIKSNTVKEVQKEAGLNVVATRLIALQDRNLHNPPMYAHGVIKAFMLCEVIKGSFSKNIETLKSHYFSLDNLPKLAQEKVTSAQIEMYFKAHKDKRWISLVD